MTEHSASASAELVAKATVQQTWDIAQPLTPAGFYPKSGLLPAVLEVRDQTGAWDAPGQTRQLMLSDGGSVVEHIRTVESPSFFAYELTDFQKLFGRIVKYARSEWRFTEVAEGTHIQWTYTFFALPGMRWVLAAIVGLLWRPYMAKVLPGIVAEVERRANS
jgi:hypothetical protein